MDSQKVGHVLMTILDTYNVCYFAWSNHACRHVSLRQQNLSRHVVVLSTIVFPAIDYCDNIFWQYCNIKMLLMPEHITRVTVTWIFLAVLIAVFMFCRIWQNSSMFDMAGDLGGQYRSRGACLHVDKNKKCKWLLFHYVMVIFDKLTF